MIRALRRSLIGDDEGIATPLGPRKLLYADHTASGRALAFVEQHLANNVLPLYGNTHTTTSECGFQSHMFLCEARDTVRDATNASERNDVVLFVGRGSTAASNCLVHHLAPGAVVGPAATASAPAPRQFVGSLLAAGDKYAAEPALVCAFPLCGRRFQNAVDMHMHARTHPDGESTARRLHGATAGSAAAAQRASTDGHCPTMEIGAARLLPPAIVVIGPYAHHSSILPWRERGCFLLWARAPQGVQAADSAGADAAASARRDAQWGVDMDHLHAQLVRALEIQQQHFIASGFSPPLVGVFTAASNVTGMLVDADRVSALLHAFGGTAVWDCAASAPHVGLDMNPTARFTLRQLLAAPTPPPLPIALDCAEEGEGAAAAAAAASESFSAAKDAAYFSAHKLVGGPGAPGVLILKRALLRAGPPREPGGGTVFFVHGSGAEDEAAGADEGATSAAIAGGGWWRARPRYLANDAEREEAGSPDTVGACRASLALRVMASSVGWGRVAAREAAMGDAARAALAAHPRIRVLGCNNSQCDARLPVVSLVIAAEDGTSAECPPPRLLHWGYVCALLNDLFGIQARGGCLCAGPYVQDLLGIGPAAARALEGRLLDKDELLRPGVVRVSACFTASHAAFRFLLAALLWAADHGAGLLWLYAPDPESGEWRVNRSLAAALLGEAYAAAAMASSSSTSSSSGAAALPRAVIAAATTVSGREGKRHVAEAARGGTRTHPRRWLADLRLHEDGRVSIPHYRIAVRCRDEEGNEEGEEGASVAGATWNKEAARPSERELHAAYLAEADMLRAAAARKEPASAAALAHHDPASLLSAQGQAMRWFALATDRLSPPPPPPPAARAGDAAEAGATALCARLQVWRPAMPSTDPPTAAPVALHSPSDDAACRFTSCNSPLWRGADSTWQRLAVLDILSAAQALEWDRGGQGSPAPAGPSSLSGTLASTGDELSQQPQLPEEEGEPHRIGYDGKMREASGGAAVAASGLPGAADSAVLPAAAGEGAPPAGAFAGAVRAGLGKGASAHAARVQLQLQRATGPAVALLVEQPGSTPLTRPLDVSGVIQVPQASGGGGRAFGYGHSRGSGGGGGVSSSHRRRPAAMSEAAYRARGARAAAVQAALAAALPPPPAKLASSLRQQVSQALSAFAMVREGDRLMVGLSGGKDSMSLLVLLLMLRDALTVRFEVGACTINPMYPGFNPAPLHDFCAALRVPYHYVSEPLIDLAAEHMTRDSICAWCARMKRGLLYTTARRYGYTTLVLGQHLDDCAESFVMSAFRNGVLRTMKAAYTNDAGDVRIIRPLVFVRERHTREFAAAMRLPVISDNCPACYTGPTERYHVKKLLAAEEAVNGSLFRCLLAAMQPLMDEHGATAVRGLELRLQAQQGRGGGGGGGGAGGDAAASLSTGLLPPSGAANAGGSECSTDSFLIPVVRPAAAMPTCPERGTGRGCELDDDE